MKVRTDTDMDDSKLIVLNGGKEFLYIFKNKQDPTNAREILSRSDLQEKTGSGFQETDQIHVLEILSGLKFLYILYKGQVKSFYLP